MSRTTRALVGISLIAAGGLGPLAAPARPSVPVVQELVWDYQASYLLPASSHFGEALALARSGDQVLIAAPNDGARAGYLWSPAAGWMPVSGTDSGWGPQVIALAADDGGIAYSRLDEDFTSSVRFEAASEASIWPLVAGILGVVTAIAKQGDVLAFGAAAFGSGAGRIWIYELQDGHDEWEPVLTIGGAEGAGLGRALALDDGVLVAGAPGEGDCGAVHVYLRGSSWIDLQTIECPSSTQVDADFGDALALDGDLLAVGAPRLDRTGGAIDAGGVYLYRVDFLQFVLESFVRPAEVAAGDEFGSSLALFSWGEHQVALLAGAPLADSPFSDGGRAYLYLDWGSWRLFRPLGISEGANTRFGTAVALGKHGAVVGAPRSDGNDVEDQGAVFAFNGILPLFYDGFDRGDTGAWSDAAP